MKKIIMLLALIAISDISFGYPDKESNTDFVIYRNQKAIGNMKVVSKKCIQGFKISLFSEINTRIVLEFNIQSVTENVMGPQYMIASFTERKINGSTRNKHIVGWENGAYTSKGKEGFSGPIPEKIKCTTTALYFKEPIGITEVYAENHMCMAPLKQIAKNAYFLDLPEGNWTKFFYEDGVLIKVIAKSMYGEVLFKRS
jgi:hypothetical protein